MLSLIAWLFAVAASPAPAVAPSYPPITLPAGWAPYGDAKGTSEDREWRPPANPDEAYPRRLLYNVHPNASYADAVATWRKIVTCSDGDAGKMLAYMHICGFAVDQDEQCKGHAAHRFVRSPANLGPPELVAVTYLYVPYQNGYLEMEYYRPSTEFAPARGGEREDPVLAAMRTWCESVPAPAASP